MQKSNDQDSTKMNQYFDIEKEKQAKYMRDEKRNKDMREEERQRKEYFGIFYFDQPRVERYFDDQLMEDQHRLLLSMWDNEIVENEGHFKLVAPVQFKEGCFGLMAQTTRTCKKYGELTKLLSPPNNSKLYMHLHKNDEDMPVYAKSIEDCSTHFSFFDENPYMFFPVHRFNYCECVADNVWKRKWHLEWALNREHHTLCLSLFEFFTKQCILYNKYGKNPSDENFCIFLNNVMNLFIKGVFKFNGNNLVWL